MKCPECGADVTGKEVCSKCGRKCSLTPQEIEVEYKNFTISEFLEIRQKGSGSPSPEAACGKGENVFQEAQKPVYAKEQAGGRSMGKTAVTQKIPSKQPVSSGKISSFPIVLAALLLIAVIIGAWYLWRFLTIP